MDNRTNASTPHQNTLCGTYRSHHMEAWPITLMKLVQTKRAGLLDQSAPCLLCQEATWLGELQWTNELTVSYSLLQAYSISSNPFKCTVCSQESFQSCPLRDCYYYHQHNKVAYP